MATRAIYNTDVEKYRQAELDYVTRTHSASSEQQSEGFNNLKAYAVIQKHQGQAIDSTLENMLEEGRNQVKALEELEQFTRPAKQNVLITAVNQILTKY